MHDHYSSHHAASGAQKKPAKTSSKARVGRGERAAEQQAQALANATSGASVANYPAIFEGFAAKGVPVEEIRPRENVFTFNAWKALGRVVKRGEKGVRVVTVIPCTKKDPETGDEKPVRKPKATTVFHVSQTEPLDAARPQ